MNLQSSIVVTLVLLAVLYWLLKNFFEKRLTSGQTLFWIVPLVVAQILGIYPKLIDKLSVVWGNLVPVSWITFVSMALSIFYLLYLTIRLNGYSRVVDLARNVAQLERRLRETETRCQELSRRLGEAE